MQTINWKGHGAMFGANAIWGLMSPVAKFVMLGGIVTPLAVTDLRIVGAMILFWILSFFRKSEHVPPKDLAKLFGASLLGVVLNQGSFILGVGMTSPVNASIITTSMPLWAMILAAIFLKEPITAKKVLGIAAGASGALLLVLGSGNTDSAGGHSVAGDLLVLFAQLSYALYFVLYKNFVTRYSLTTIMKWMFTFATLCILPFTGRDLLSTDWQALSAAAIGSLAFIVVGSTFLSYMLIIVGQKKPASDRRRHVQLHPAAGRYISGRMLGYGNIRSDQNLLRIADFQRCLSGDNKPQPGRCGEVPLTAGKPPETTVESRTPHTQRPGNGEDPRKYRAFRPEYAEEALPDTDSE